MKLYSFVDNHDVDRIYSKINVKEHIFLFIRFCICFQESRPSIMVPNGELRAARIMAGTTRSDLL